MVIKEIEKARQARQDGPRSHLGASIIGDPCARKLWYSFRWAYHVQHGGRLLRLFDRGHLEEFRFVEYLRMAGFEVRDYSQRLCYHDASDSYVLCEWDEEPPYYEVDDVSDDAGHIKRAASRGEGPKQWGFADHENHFAGSADGKIYSKEFESWGLLEFKTHSYKSFEDMRKRGLISSKRTHWVQMQIYLHYLGLPWGLYLAVNKNNDELYEEFVEAKPEIAAQYIERAAAIIAAPQPPARLSNDPSWYECRFCDFREICHYDKPRQKNCRACAFSKPAEDGAWRCQRFHQEIPAEFIPKGCDKYET